MSTKPKRGPGRPRIKGPAALGEVIAVRLNKGIASRLDKWRQAGRDLTRSEAVRALTEQGLGADGF